MPTSPTPCPPGGALQSLLGQPAVPVQSGHINSTSYRAPKSGAGFAPGLTARGFLSQFSCPSVTASAGAFPVGLRAGGFFFVPQGGRVFNNPFNFAQASELFTYSHESGELRWKNPPGSKVKCGDLAGWINAKGRVVVRWQGLGVYGHRLAWLLYFGEWPAQHLDHIDGNPANNRIANLRVATVRLNNENRRKPMSNNQTGLLGVSPSRSGRRFYATIRTHGRSTYLGSYATPQEAYEAYVKAKKVVHAGCTL